MATTIPSLCRTRAKRTLRGVDHRLHFLAQGDVGFPTSCTPAGQTHRKARPAFSISQRLRNWMRQPGMFGKLACPLVAAGLLIVVWTLAADTRSGGNVVFTTETYDAGGARTSGGAVVNDGSLGGVGDQVIGGGITLNGGYPAQFPPTAPPPTAAILLSFDARWTRAGEVALDWQTGVEFDLLGFQLQRQEANGKWLGVNAGIIPSVGTGHG